MPAQTARWDSLAGSRTPFGALRSYSSDIQGLARIWIFPILITASLLASLLYGAWALHDQVVDAFWVAPTGDGTGNMLLRFAHGFLEVLTAVLGFLVAFLFAMLLSSVIAAPFNSKLSVEVERLTRGNRSARLRLGSGDRLGSPYHRARASQARGVPRGHGSALGADLARSRAQPGQHGAGLCYHGHACRGRLHRPPARAARPFGLEHLPLCVRSLGADVRLRRGRRGFSLRSAAQPVLAPGGGVGRNPPISSPGSRGQPPMRRYRMNHWALGPSKGRCGYAKGLP